MPFRKYCFFPSVGPNTSTPLLNHAISIMTTSLTPISPLIIPHLIILAPARTSPLALVVVRSWPLGRGVTPPRPVQRDGSDRLNRCWPEHPALPPIPIIVECCGRTSCSLRDPIKAPGGHGWSVVHRPNGGNVAISCYAAGPAPVVAPIPRVSRHGCSVIQVPLHQVPRGRISVPIITVVGRIPHYGARIHRPYPGIGMPLCTSSQVVGRVPLTRQPVHVRVIHRGTVSLWPLVMSTARAGSDGIAILLATAVRVLQWRGRPRSASMHHGSIHRPVCVCNDRWNRGFAHRSVQCRPAAPAPLSQATCSSDRVTSDLVCSCRDGTTCDAWVRAPGSRDHLSPRDRVDVVVAPDGGGRIVMIGLDGERGTSWVVERWGARPSVSVPVSHLAWRRPPGGAESAIRQCGSSRGRPACRLEGV